MTECEMEDLLWEYPELLFKETLRQFRRQAASGVSRADLVFTDSVGRLLVVEVKKGILPRNAIPQAIDHFGGMKLQHPNKAIEMMVVANQIPPERKVTLANYHIEWLEIPEPRYREVAAEKGYVFRSEQAHAAVSSPSVKPADAVPAPEVCAPGSVNAYKRGNPHDLFRMLHSERPVLVVDFLRAINTTVGWKVIHHARRSSPKTPGQLN